MRFSTVPGEHLDDRRVDARGLSVKIIGVEGERLSDPKATSPGFRSGTPGVWGTTPKKSCRYNFAAKTTDRAQELKSLSALCVSAARDVAVTGRPNVTVATLGGQPELHIWRDLLQSSRRALR